jgi:hypothetical protein
LVVVEICFQVKERGSDGAVQGGGVLWVFDDGVDLLRNNQARGVRRCAERRERWRNQKRAAVHLGVVRIGELSLQIG